MLGELAVAGNLLQSALERYRNACSAVESYCNDSSPTEAESSQLSNEICLLRALAKTLYLAKVSIQYSRNSSRYIVPINRLPPEILFRILNLAVISDHETWNNRETRYRHNRIHRQPIGFASVCVRWRKFMLQCPTFWSRIDTVHVGGGNMTRAKIWADRAGSCPLDIHMAVASYDFSNRVLTEFLSFITSHSLGSFSFTLFRVNDPHKATIFRECFSSCAPGALQKLVIEKINSYGTRYLIKSTAGSEQTQVPEDYLLIDLPHEHLEALWRPIKILRFYGMYIDWGSQAYHALVELCLLPDHQTLARLATISESQLKAILTSSPGLRIFRFGLIVLPDISLVLPASNATGPVQLDDLEILDLDLDSRSESSLQYVLRWVSPGSKPLKLLLPRTRGTISGTDLIARNRSDINHFLMRAKVVELCLKTRGISPDWLLTSAPNLRTLCVWLNHGNPSPVDQGELSLSIPPGTIDTLYILSSNLRMDRLCQWLSRFPPIQKLVFWKCFFTFGNQSTIGADKLLSHPQLLNICSEVKCIPASDGHTPMTGWGVIL